MHLIGGFADFNAAFPQFVDIEETIAPALPTLITLSAPSPNSAKIKITNLEPTEIIPHLYIGARKDATNHDTLKRLGITCIVNCTKDCPNAFEGDVQYLQIPVDVCFMMYYFHGNMG